MSLIAPDGGALVDLILPDNQRVKKRAEATDLPKLPVTDYDVQWIHVLSEGWASPLRGFMREDEFLQTLHFNCLRQHDGTRVNMSIPITLDVSTTNYNRLKNEKAVALVNTEGRAVAILRDPEFYPHPKEERAARTFGLTHPAHPSIERINSMGDYLVGGELEVSDRITYNDGLDQYRLSPAELRAEYERRGADVVYAFQLRNPIHNGHALLMNETRDELKKQGYQNPMLLLHPLGGWTKADDVPLPVRMRQHDAVLEDGVLDADTTVVSIFPSPMLYAGPTEVQWHAKARMNAGADYYIVGRDPAGMPHPERLDSGGKSAPLYDPWHGVKALQTAVGLERLNIVPFRVAAYDKAAGEMGFFEPDRAADFLFVSGSQMRAYARSGESPPDGFMSEKAWQVIVEYYASMD